MYNPAVLRELDAAQVWPRLIAGHPLDDLGLPRVDGRIDLRGLSAPEPATLQQYMVAGTEVRRLGNLVEIRGAQWTGLDFSNARLESLRFFDVRIEQCSFDGARCRDWRMWNTSVEDTSFRKTDLRNAALGGVDGQKRNSFRRVEFAHTDLRGTVWFSSNMTHCTFDHAKLKSVDFHGTVFEDCTFVGDLEDTTFYRHASGGDAFPPNEMKNVDLRRAALHFVGFRGLDMTSVKWPDGEDHVVVHDYPAKLDKLLVFLRDRTDDASRGLVGLIQDSRKWIGPRQRTGIISRHDLVEIGGKNFADEILSHLRNPS
jgi:uncharacterized protein YjbI with pentapeptide repeats